MKDEDLWKRGFGLFLEESEKETPRSPLKQLPLSTLSVSN